jgi:hypothetical protein
MSAKNDVPEHFINTGLQYAVTFVTYNILRQFFTTKNASSKPGRQGAYTSMHIHTCETFTICSAILSYLLSHKEAKRYLPYPGKYLLTYLLQTRDSDSFKIM